MANKKMYCYKNECEVTITGFQFNEWKVCTKCKEEISDELYNRAKEKEKKKDEKVNDEYYDTWGYRDPEGDV